MFDKKAIEGLKNRKIKIKKIADIAKRNEDPVEKQVKNNTGQTKLKQLTIHELNSMYVPQ